MNFLTIHALLLDTITKLKFGTDAGLTRNNISAKARNEFKKLRGLPKNASTKVLFNNLCEVYIENKQEEKLRNTLKRFNLEY